jgi:hypothetical protein
MDGWMDGYGGLRFIYPLEIGLCGMDKLLSFADSRVSYTYEFNDLTSVSICDLCLRNNTGMITRFTLRAVMDYFKTNTERENKRSKGRISASLEILPFYSSL